MNCECHKVTQNKCRRKAVAARVTTKGITIYLCNKCDKNFGETVGSLEIK
jgi:transposase-like protein